MVGLLHSYFIRNNFKSRPVSEFRIIHFAVHVVSVPDFPDRDALILGGDPHTNDDGLLQVSEIARLSLNAGWERAENCHWGLEFVVHCNLCPGARPSFGLRQ